MANTIPHGSKADAQFSFTKLLVHDLDRSAAFYKSLPEMNLRVAFVQDVEGHLIEVVQLL